MILIEILPRRSFSHWARSLWWYMVDWRHLSSVATSSMTQTISSSATRTMSTYGLQFHSTSTSSTCSCLCCKCWGQRIVELVNLPLQSCSPVHLCISQIPWMCMDTPIWKVDSVGATVVKTLCTAQRIRIIWKVDSVGATSFWKDEMSLYFYSRSKYESQGLFYFTLLLSSSVKHVNTFLNADGLVC